METEKRRKRGKRGKESFTSSVYKDDLKVNNQQNQNIKALTHLTTHWARRKKIDDKNTDNNNIWN